MALLDVSKMITERQGWCEFVDWFMQVYREDLASSVTELFETEAEEGEPVPDFLSVINALIKVLRRSMDNLIEAEMTLLDEVSETALSRQLRDELIRELRAGFSQGRGLLRNAYGTQLAKSVGFPDRIADPWRSCARLCGSVGRCACRSSS